MMTRNLLGKGFTLKCQTSNFKHSAATMKWLYVLLLLVSYSVRSQTHIEGLPQIHLTDSVRCTSVKDQAQSPTCWTFGTNSLFESDLIKKNGTELNLSEMFIARYAYIDKAKKFLATGGTTYYAGGGQFHDVIRVINKYGITPEEVYNGRPNGEEHHDHAKLDTSMKRYVNNLKDKGKKELSREDEKNLNDTLDHYLGKVPQVFFYKGKSYTPLSFAKDVVKFDNDYVEIMSFANMPFYKKCLLVDKFNWAGDSLYNIPLMDMQMLIDSALSKGWSLGWEGDVTNPGFNSFAGMAATELTYDSYDSIRVSNYRNETTERDHMMHLIGIGRDQGNNKWYYLKNSWGTWFSRFNGFLYMNENYFKLNTCIMMVNKAALPTQLRNRLHLPGL